MTTRGGGTATKDDDSNPSTYSNQSKLKRLPLPTLEETMEKFNRTLQAMQSDEHHLETQTSVSQFLANDGPKLQTLLQKYNASADGNGVGSYVEEFWSDSYLAPDCSVVLNLNPFFLLESHPDPKTASDPVLRASELVFASLKLVYRIQNETLAPDTFRGKPLCMDQFKALFGSCRVPHEGQDVVCNDPGSRHVVVMRKNVMYYFVALWPDGTLAVSIADLVDILQAIVEDADNLNSDAQQEGNEGEEQNKASSWPKNAPVGVLTTLDRRSWSVARTELLAVPESDNESALQIVDSALFVLCLDDVAPEDINDSASNMLHGTYRLKRNSEDAASYYQAGTCCNRWYDKLQIIVCEDGSAGVNFEHSAIDGHTALRFVADVFAETIINFAQSITKTIYGGTGSTVVPSVIDAPLRRATVLNESNEEPLLDVWPKRLDFSLNPKLDDMIFHAETHLGDQILSVNSRVLEYKGFGKNFITANKLSPDSFVQMSMLVAYYILYGKTANAYEASISLCMSQSLVKECAFLKLISPCA